jgi:L-arabinonolactonase
VRISLTVYPAGADWVSGVYDWDAETGLISNRQPFFDNNARRPAALTDPVSAALGPGNPDGHTLDTAGRVYQAVFARACIERFAPDGTHDLTIELPARCPTCPMFGGDALTSLYVTTASEALLPGEAAAGDLGGSVLRIDLAEVLGEGVKGTVKHEFAG